MKEDQIKKMQAELATDKVQDPENEFSQETKEAVLKELNYVDLPAITLKMNSEMKV